MCWGTTYVFRCCGRRQIVYDERLERCPPAEIEHNPHHVVRGITIGLNRPCPVCVRLRRAREREVNQDRMDERRTQGEREKAVREYLRGDRPTPLTDEALAELSPLQRRAVERRSAPINIHSPEELADARQTIADWALGEELDSPPGSPDSDSSPFTPDMPLTFREWTLVYQGSPSGLTLLTDVNNYINYLGGISGTNYRSSFITGSMVYVSGRYRGFNFTPTDPSGHLMSFLGFIQAAGFPMPSNTNDLEEASQRYSGYLLAQGSPAHQSEFTRYREEIGSSTREYLNTLAPTGIATPYHEPSFQTFREWSRRHDRSINPERLQTPWDARLQTDLDEYERYLSQGTHETARRMLRQFRELRGQIRAAELQNFTFYPHVEGLPHFREGFEEGRDPSQIWDQRLQEYSRFLEQHGHHDVAGRFNQARREYMDSDRRQFEGRRRHRLQRRWEISLNPNLMSSADLSWRLTFITNEIRDHLARSLVHPSRYITVALIALASQAHNYVQRTAGNREPTLQEWEEMIGEIRTIGLAFSRDIPGQRIFQPYGRPIPHRTANNNINLGDDLLGNIGRLHHSEIAARVFEGTRLYPLARISSPRNYTGALANVPGIQDWMNRPGGNRPPMPLRGDPHTPMHRHPQGVPWYQRPESNGYNPESLVYHFQQQNLRREQRNRVRRRRQRLNLRPSTPEIEDGQSDETSGGGSNSSDDMNEDPTGEWRY